MNRKIRFLLLLIGGILLNELVVYVIDEYGGSSSETKLELTAISSVLAEGDEIELELRYKNTSLKPLSVVPPLSTSWDQLAQPYYILEFVDKDGKLVPNVLGRQPIRDCGVHSTVVHPRNIVRVAPRKTITLTGTLTGRGPHMWVQETARPGTYRVRVRYVADDIPGATPMELVSNEVEVVVNGGNEQLWQCYQDQLYLEGNHSYSTLEPGGVLPWGSDILLVYKHYQRTVNNRQVTGESGFYIQRLDHSGRPSGDPTVIYQNSSVTYLESSILVPDGALFLFRTSSPETLEYILKVAHVSVGKEEIQPDDPYIITEKSRFSTFLGFARHKETVGLVYEYQEESTRSRKLIFQALDSHGRPTTESHMLFESESISGYSGIHMAPTESGFVVLWEDNGKENLMYLDKTGNPISPVYPINLHDERDEMTVRTFWVEADKTYVVVQDRAGTGDLSKQNFAGLYLVQLRDSGQLIGEPIPLTPQTSIDDIHWGTAASTGKSLGRLVHHDSKIRFRVHHDSRIHFGIFEKDISDPLTSLSDSAGGTYELAATSEHFFIAWDDWQNDNSITCIRADHPIDCVTEVYFAGFNSEGELLIPPTRITESARPRPFLFLYQRDIDWQTLCELEW